jgi:alpha-glucosidase
MQKKLLMLLISLVAFLNGEGQAPKGGDAVYQYSVPVGARRAYLWVAPQCRRVRGLIIAAENALELNWMEDPIIRKTAEELGLGMIWLADGKPTNITFEMKPDAVASLDTMFHDLAVESGFPEIENAPLIVTGHSWNGRMAWNYPNVRPERVLAAIPIRTYPLPDTLLFSGIPMLYMVGQTTELPEYSDGRPGDRDFYWPVVRRTALALRRADEDNLIGVVVHPGGLHMDWSADQSRFLALFIRKACRYRLPVDAKEGSMNDRRGVKDVRRVNDGGGVIPLRKIDRRSGWLTDTGGMEPDHYLPAPYNRYKGDPKAAYWFFDEEMARAAVAFNGDRKKRALQMLTFVRDGVKLPVARSGYVNYKYLPGDDGIRFKMKGGFLDSIPGGLIGAGNPLGHAKGAFTYRVTMGPGRQVGPDIFRVEFTRQKPRNIMIVATQAGDGHYRKAKQPAIVEVPAKLVQGEAQVIDFPVLSDVVVGKKAVALGATASSGLPVRYYVVSGPARVEGDSLRFAEIPVWGRYPIKITVVAYQWGRMVAPLYQSASPVMREFFLTKGGRNQEGMAGRKGCLWSVASPDKRMRIELGVDAGQLQYRVFDGGRKVMEWSALGLEMKEGKVGEGTKGGNVGEWTKEGIAGKAIVIEHTAVSEHRGSFAWPFGENARVENNYRQMILSCRSGLLKYRVVVRVFDGSVAFRYEIDGRGEGYIQRENTQFNFCDPLTLYQYNQESVFKEVLIDTFNRTCDLPATLKGDHGLYISIGEADNRDYTKAELKRGEGLHSLYPAFVRDSVVRWSGPFRTPWRTISISGTAIGLHAYSDLYLRLTDEAVGGIPPGIRPGKLIRAQLTTQSGLDCVDFAVKHRFQYVLFDAGWYGAEFRSTADPTHSIAAIDLPAVIRYGKEKGIGVILYVNYVGLRTYLDTLLPLYQKWGVSGMKFGFVDGLSQQGIEWLAGAIQKVNEAGLILDIHDNYKPTGLSRTYPALLTQEGIRGEENSPDAYHTTVLPFTRFLAGPADFTFCYPNSKNSFSKNLKVSKAQQLALTVIYFSPLQSIFWYGQPTDYTNEGEIEFFTRVPTVWEESRYLAGEPGKCISVARRKDGCWYIGNAAGPEDWKDSVHLDFLESGKIYTATVYEDDGAGSIRKRIVEVKRGMSVPFALKAAGGQAWIIEPKQRTK